VGNHSVLLHRYAQPLRSPPLSLLALPLRLDGLTRRCAFRMRPARLALTELSEERLVATRRTMAANGCEAAAGGSIEYLVADWLRGTLHRACLSFLSACTCTEERKTVPQPPVGPTTRW
jgi:hypothetical protein